MEIWINPECSKCQTALSALDEAGLDYTVRRYLDVPPSRDELEQVVARLGLEPWDIARERESADLGIALPPRDADNRAAWLDLLAAHPEVIQRPIVTADDDTTVIARDADALARVTALGRTAD